MLTFFDDFGRWTGPTFWINPETGEWRLVSSGGVEQCSPVSRLSEAEGVQSSLNVKAAAKILGCSPSQVRRLVHQGKLGHHWVGKNLRFRQQDLDDFWASQAKKRSDKTSSNSSRENDRKRSETKRPDPVALPPTRREVDKLWQ